MRPAAKGGEPLQTWRERHGLTQQGCADMLGISRTLVGKIEGGQPLPQLVRLAMAGAELEMSK